MYIVENRRPRRICLSFRITIEHKPDCVYKRWSEPRLFTIRSTEFTLSAAERAQDKFIIDYFLLAMANP